MWTTSRPWAMALGCLLLMGIGTTGGTARAAMLKEFTGYTRIGFPPSEGKVDPKYEEYARKTKPIGLTIYFTVLDRKEVGDKGREGDIWGTGIDNFDKGFAVSLDSDRRTLDTKARYLYLYQVLNDSGRPAAIKEITIRLVVDPRLITSWGSLGNAPVDGGKAAGRGVGFSALFTNPDPKGREKIAQVALPISTDRPGVIDKLYRSPAPAVKAPMPYGFTSIPIGNIPAAGGEDRGRAPEAVHLINNAYFGS